jgi:hypothetical protein
VSLSQMLPECSGHLDHRAEWVKLSRNPAAKALKPASAAPLVGTSSNKPAQFRDCSKLETL